MLLFKYSVSRQRLGIRISIMMVHGNKTEGLNRT